MLFTPETVFRGALSQYPLIVRQPSPLTVDVGHRAVLECRAEGAVVFDWYKDGKPFRKGARDGRLVFEKVRLEDGGEYQCAVVNDRAEVKSSIAKLTVGTLLADRHACDIASRVSVLLSMLVSEYPLAAVAHAGQRYGSLYLSFFDHLFIIKRRDSTSEALNIYWAEPVLSLVEHFSISQLGYRMS